MTKKSLYILIEGEPNSPEVPFLKDLVTKIFRSHGYSYDRYVIEVGSSSAFNAFAKFCYRDSKLHEEIPVLALSDRDYSVVVQDKEQNNQVLIKNGLPKVLYWKRHEWENYLLDELEVLIDFANQLPNNSKNGKAYKNNPKCNISIQNIESALITYFKSVVKDELWACLKFNLQRKIKQYPSVVKPDDFDSLTLNKVAEWFNTELKKTHFNLQFAPQFKDENLFEQIKNYFPWEAALADRELLEQAKIKFRGKEAFNALYKFLNDEFQFHNLKEKELIDEIFKHWRGNKDCAIYKDIESMLLPELQNIIQSRKQP